MQIIWDTSQDNAKDLKVTLRRNIGMSTSPEFKNPLLERNKGTSLLMLRMTDSNHQRPCVKMCMQLTTHCHLVRTTSPFYLNQYDIYMLWLHKIFPFLDDILSLCFYLSFTSEFGEPLLANSCDNCSRTNALGMSLHLFSLASDMYCSRSSPQNELSSLIILLSSASIVNIHYTLFPIAVFHAQEVFQGTSKRENCLQGKCTN